MDLTKVIECIVMLLCAIITYVLIPYIKSKTTEEQQKKLHLYVKMAVQAAEMLFKETGMGAIKKEYVANFLKEKGYQLDSNDLDVVIESAVLELKKNFE